MPLREIIGKTFAFGLVSVCLLAGAALGFVGPHPYIDFTFPYLTVVLVAVLALMGVGVAGLGVLSIAAIILDARMTQKEQEVHVTPRRGAPDVPPAWGMGEIGRPHVGEGGGQGSQQGGGATRVMSVSVSNIDGPIL
ncbi:MAG TPA: hypothetical protein VE219_04130, partial [Candidatus Sulfotelmatobacter sp.]|nr:hypothetical protein [Candidatus Sulfotelmatobacter sp.]